MQARNPNWSTAIGTWLQSPQGLGMIAALTEAGQPGPYRQSIGSALGRGLLYGNQFAREQERDGYQKNLADLRARQMELNEKKLNLELDSFKQSQESARAINEALGLTPPSGGIGSKPATRVEAPQDVQIPLRAPNAGLLGSGNAAPQTTLNQGGQVGVLNNLDPVQRMLFAQTLNSGNYKQAYDMLYGKNNNQTSLQKNLQAAGLQPGTPEFQDALMNQMNKRQMTINLPSPPQGYFYVDPENPSAGLKAIPGGPSEELAPEKASKLQMQNTAAKQLPLIQSLLFDENGTPNYKNITLSQNVPLLVTDIQGIPHTSGRQMRAAYEQGIQAITRGETGAAMPQEELQNTMARFFPSPLDDAATVKLKWEMYNDFITGNLKLLDPTGRFNTVRFNEQFKRRRDELVGKKQGIEGSDSLGIR